MTLETVPKSLGQGGAKLYDGVLRKILAEQQGLKFVLVAGAAANTKMNVTGLSSTDTLLAVLALAGAGTTVTDVVDQLSASAVVKLYASGTLTLSGVVAADTVVVRGHTYTFRVAPSVSATTLEVAKGASDNAAAANLAAAINIREAGFVSAAAVGAVVTITALAEGTAGNAYTIVGGAHITASGATLAGGSATGGITCTNSTTPGKVLVIFVDKGF